MGYEYRSAARMPPEAVEKAVVALRRASQFRIVSEHDEGAGRVLELSLVPPSNGAQEHDVVIRFTERVDVLIHGLLGTQRDAVLKTIQQTLSSVGHRCEFQEA
jgi:hypothetical protein